eukprot:976851_1
MYYLFISMNYQSEIESFLNLVFNVKQQYNDNIKKFKAHTLRSNPPNLLNADLDTTKTRSRYWYRELFIYLDVIRHLHTNKEIFMQIVSKCLGWNYNYTKQMQIEDDVLLTLYRAIRSTS